MLFQFAGLQSEQAATTRNILHQEQDSVLSVATTAQQDTALVTSTPETTAPHTGGLFTVFSGVLQTVSHLPKTTDDVRIKQVSPDGGMVVEVADVGGPDTPTQEENELEKREEAAASTCTTANLLEAGVPSAAQPSSEVQPSQAQQGYEVS